MLEFHNLEWERMRLRLQQREVQTGMLELLSRNLGHEVRVVDLVEEQDWAVDTDALAAVVDEHGDFAGIVTMADCLQALLGQVADTALHDAELVPRLAELVEREVMLGGPGADTLNLRKGDRR